MNNQNTRIIHKDDLHLGGFAGIVETQMVINPEVFGPQHKNQKTSEGLGGLLYLASGYFKPEDGSDLHPHIDVDIITVIFKGELVHAGTLGEGTRISAPGAQVQRTGTGIRHLEKNPNQDPADFIQLWFAPPEKGLKPAYQNISLEKGKITTLLGGEGETYINEMNCKAGLLSEGEMFSVDKEFLVFVHKGTALVNEDEVVAGDIIEGQSLQLIAKTDLEVVIIHK